MNNLTIKPATSEDANDHYEVFDSCHDILFSMFVILSMVDRKQMESYDDESVCMALNNYARLGLLVIEAMHAPVYEMRKLIASQDAQVDCFSKGRGQVMSAKLQPSTPIRIQQASLFVSIAHFEMFDNSLAGIGVLKGDSAVVLLDADIQSGDFVLVHLTGEGLRVLQYHTAPSNRIKLRTYEYQKSRRWAKEKKDAVILGRVVQFQSDGKAVQTIMELRPVC